MSCFVFVVLAGGLGFLSFLGVVLACPSCFLGLLGFSVFLVVLLLLVGVGGGLRGVPGFGVRCARVSCFLLVGGWAGGCACARLSVLLPPCWGGGFGCACCPVPVVGVGLCPVSSAACCGGGFRVLFFPSGASRVFWFCGAWSFVGLWFPRGRGVVGGVGLGSGLFFLRLLLYWPGLVSGFLRGGWFGFGLGFVWRV